MVPLFAKETGTLFTVMREERFKELQRKQKKRRKAHYIDALTKSFNFDLDENEQLSLFEEEQFEEKEVKKIVKEILGDFQVECSVIHRYATILFEEYNSEIISIRCCVLDSSLQVIDEDSWSGYIHHTESVVVDTVESNSEERQMPKIKLKDKARKRIGQKDIVAMKNDTLNGDAQIL